MKAQPFIYQKLAALFHKHEQEGNTPRQVLESNIAREFRVSKEEVRKIMEEMNLGQNNMRRKKLKETYEYHENERPDYQAEMRTFR